MPPIKNLLGNYVVGNFCHVTYNVLFGKASV
jgi:hypothetical protein